jgi:hypothetical protein
MNHGNMMTINLDVHRYPRVRPRRKKQGYQSELLEIKNLPLPRTTKTWTSASFLISLRRSAEPARRFLETVKHSR